MNTKSALLTLLLLALPVLAAAQVEKQISAIRREVAAINKNAPKFTKAEREVDNISAEGATAVFFTESGEIRKITARIYGETGQSVVEYFYNGGELIFAFQRAQHYDKPIDGGRAPKVSKISEIRAYFEGGKCIRLLDGKLALKEGTVEYDESLYGLVETADAIRAKF